MLNQGFEADYKIKKNLLNRFSNRVQMAIFAALGPDSYRDKPRVKKHVSKLN